MGPKKKQSNDAALFGALVGGFFGAASAPSHASGDQVFAQGLLGLRRRGHGGTRKRVEWADEVEGIR
jgi:hypothetical protein